MKINMRGFSYIRRFMVFTLIISIVLCFAPITSNAFQSVRYADQFNYPLNSDGSPIWTTSGGTWTTQADGGAVYCANTTQQAFAVSGDSTWTDYTYSIKVKSNNSMGNGMCLRINDVNNLYIFQIDNSSTVSLAKLVNGTRTVIGTAAYSTNLMQWYNLSASVTGSQIKAYIDGQLLINITDSTFSSGKIGLYAQSNVSFDDLEVTGIPGLFDDFSSTSGYWNAVSGTWTVTSGIYQGSGSGDEHYSLSGSSLWGNYIYEAKVKGVSGLDGGMVFRVKDENNLYFFRAGYDNKASLYKRVNGVFSLIKDVPLSISLNTWHTLKIEAYDFKICAFVDGQEVFEAYDTQFASGKIGLRTSSGNELHFDDARVYAVPNYTDMFDNGVNGWIFDSSAWTVGGNQKLKADIPVGQQQYGLTGDANWQDYMVSTRINCEYSKDAGIVFRAQDTNNLYLLRAGYGDYMELFKRVNGTFTRIAYAPYSLQLNTWHTIRAIVKGNSIRGYVDGTLMIDTVDNTFSQGRVGLRVDSGIASFDDVRVEALLIDDNFSRYPNGSNGSPEWSPQSGNWRVSGGKYVEDASGYDSFSFTGSTGWVNYAFESQVKWNGGIFDAGLLFWVYDSNNLFMFRPFYEEPSGTYKAGIYYRSGSSGWQACDTANMSTPFYVGQTHAIRVEVDGQDIRGYVDGKLVITSVFPVAYGTPSPRYGKVGLRVSSSSQVEFDEVKVLNIDGAPVAKSASRNSLFPRQPALASQLDYMDIREFSASDRMMTVALQGLVNRAQPRIYLSSYKYSPNDGYKDEEESDLLWKNVLDDDGYDFTTFTNPILLAQKYSDEVSGAIIYDPALWDDPNNAGILNVITTAAGVYDALPVTAEQNSALNLPVVLDTRSKWADVNAAYNWAYEELWPQCDHTVLGHDHPARTMLTDYYIANKIFVSFVQAGNEYSESLFQQLIREMPVMGGVLGVWDVHSSQTTKLTASFGIGATNLSVASSSGYTANTDAYIGINNQEKVHIVSIPDSQHIVISLGLQHAQPSGASVTPVIWNDPMPFQAWNEEQMVERTSGRGQIFQVAWQCSNLSVWSGTSQDNLGENQTISYQTKAPKTAYLTFILSDGDNLSHVFRQRQYQWLETQRGTVYLGYTFTPALFDLAPRMLKYFYSEASAQDYIVGSHGGIGYVRSKYFGQGYYPLDYEKVWDNYLAISGRYMNAAGMNTYWPIFTNIENSPNYSLQQGAQIPGVTGVFNDFLPEPSSQNLGYSNMINVYNGIPAFRTSSIPDGRLDRWVGGTQYFYSSSLDRIAADINYITPVNLTNTYVFTGLSGFFMKADDIITYVDGDGVTHQGIFDKVLAQSNYQNLIANGWTISVVRPDEFIYQYLH